MCSVNVREFISGRASLVAYQVASRTKKTQIVIVDTFEIDKLFLKNGVRISNFHIIFTFKLFEIITSVILA